MTKFVYKIVNFFCAIVIIIIIVNKPIESKPQFRIANGFKLSFGEFFSTVKITINYDSQSFRCSGVLLDNETVLTAAHCTELDNYESIIVHIGEIFSWFLFTRKVKKVTKHPNYKDYHHDIALYQLDSPIPHSDYIKYPNLPCKELTKPGDTIYLVGWGRPNYQFAATNQTVLSNEECHNSYSELNEILTGRQICSRGTDSKTSTICKGDSGGAAYFFDRKGKEWLVGINSYGENLPCGSKLKPSGMMRVSAYYKWIQQNRKSKCKNCQFFSNVRIDIKSYYSDRACSGVLLDELTVLTVAHCTALDGHYDIHLYVGDTGLLLVTSRRTNRRVVKVIRHENFHHVNRTYFHNDIALYLLNEPIPLHEDITYANIPSEEVTTPGDTAFVAVLGLSKLNLAVTTQKVITNEKCSESYMFNEIHNGRQICTNGKGDSETSSIGDCTGEPGAPGYFVDNNGKQWLIGIHSYGVGAPCGKTPTVMMRMSSYYKWIEQNQKEIRKYKEEPVFP